MVSGIYNEFKADLMQGNVNLASGGDTIKVALLNNSHSFTATNTGWSSVSSNEVSGTGYTSGGATLSGQSVTEAATTKWDATDTTFSTVTISAYHAVIYDVTNSNSLICSIDFGGEQAVTAADLTLQWDAAGIITLA